MLKSQAARQATNGRSWTTARGIYQQHADTATGIRSFTDHLNARGVLGPTGGLVFAPCGFKRFDFVRDTDWVSRTIPRIGKAAKVKVDEKGAKVKFAAAHDLRRASGAHWSTKVMQAVLQQLMRHESIDTTMKYYVGQNAEAMADAVWAAMPSSFDSSTIKLPGVDQVH